MTPQDSKVASIEPKSDRRERDILAAAGYWPAEVMKLVEEKKYSAAVQLCRERLKSGPESLSGRTAYALALYRAGQLEAAEDHFHQILARDPNHLVALKFLGDIAFARGDEWAACANYERVLELDPKTSGISCELPVRGSRETTRTITLVRPLEESTIAALPRSSAREHAHRQVMLFTETVGDLYLAQGHAKLAVEVFQRIHEKNPSPRLAEKLNQALEKSREKESPHVSQTD